LRIKPPKRIFVFALVKYAFMKAPLGKYTRKILQNPGAIAKLMLLLRGTFANVAAEQPTIVEVDGKKVRFSRATVSVAVEEPR
jgi:hypothetical protein